MLTIKTYVSFSKIDGKGCFAAEYIKKDQTIWIYSAEETFSGRIDYLEKYGYYDDLIDMFIYPMDNARYVNHSDNANTYCHKGEIKAKHDIKTGEEITENYREYMREDDIKKHLGDKKEKKAM